jgi:hypothetical protein
MPGLDGLPISRQRAHAKALASVTAMTRNDARERLGGRCHWLKGMTERRVTSQYYVEDWPPVWSFCEGSVNTSRSQPSDVPEQRENDFCQIPR